MRILIAVGAPVGAYAVYLLLEEWGLFGLCALCAIALIVSDVVGSLLKSPTRAAESLGTLPSGIAERQSLREVDRRPPPR